MLAYRALRSVPMLFAFVLVSAAAQGQTAPEIGYMYPSGGRAGSTVDVILGGYDWTPDMQLFVHDPRIKLELAGAPSPVLVPDPPYWFGAKGRGPAWPLPREFPARLTIPADVPAGLVRWQVANANGVSPPGEFFVSTGPELMEDSKRTAAQPLSGLPIAVCGQIRKIEEIDRYEFTVPKTGLVTVELLARRLNSPLHGILQVHDERGVAVVDVADSEGHDLAESFIARAGEKYTVSLHDLDFAGDRSYVYRLSLSLGPHVKAAYPAAGRRGETRRVEFVGIGVATGEAKLESIARDVTFPAAADATSHTYRLETPAGTALPFPLLVSDLVENVRETAQLAQRNGSSAGEPVPIAVPGAVTGSIDTRFGSAQFTTTLAKDQKWQLTAQARQLGSPLDLDLAVFGPDGKQVASNDDMPGTTDPVVPLTVAADGLYRFVVTDRSGKSGSRAASYRLVVEPMRPEFSFNVPALSSVPIGGAAKLTLPVTRSGGFTGPIQLTIAGLPEGIAVPPNLMVPADKNELAVDLQCSNDAPAAAALCKVTATATLNGQPVTRHAGTILVASVMKPRTKVIPEGLDDVRKVNRGTTFLAPVRIERLEGFQGEVTLEMTAKQQRHRQGLASDEFTVPAGIDRVEYPIFVPEWLETTKTSRMILNGVVKVADPRGNVRTLLNRMEMRIGILPEGAVLKLSHAEVPEPAPLGTELNIQLTLSRAAELREPVTIELVPAEDQVGLMTAEPITLMPDRSEATMAVRFSSDPRLRGEQSLRVRARALKNGRWPVVSETVVLVPIVDASR